MNDITKLPKWAQEKINSLERAMQEMMLDSKNNGTGAVYMRISSLIETKNNFVLHDRCIIEYKIGDSKKISTFLRQEGNDCYLDINGSTRIQIEPRAANSIWIR